MIVLANSIFVTMVQKCTGANGMEKFPVFIKNIKKCIMNTISISSVGVIMEYRVIWVHS